ncbi:DinB family protein [Saccharibacillus sp. CPCC 101409]|uniref:DinB family protein n=1 Tax=Saccharibacillus sp. CPCC 101409 TaxID=3058041 RepID=UPI0026722012|nr:DinB family protein [Saccharibacillus sp. CPCC 101409]MDO3411095.1 DinB family protein [Saccharibacillus sp. CPCC 101409]
MPPYCQNVYVQLDVAIESLIGILRSLNEDDLTARPTEGKMSVGELLAHISMLCEADFRIGSGASQAEMEQFYSAAQPELALPDIERALRHHYAASKQAAERLTEEEWNAPSVSYWGTSYTRFGWLLETLAHLYHHRGQLHAMLVHALRKDPRVPLFE